jgi:hypothetical protein
VPDDFPALEVAAALGLLVVAIRVYLIHSLALSIPKLHDEIVSLVGAGDLAQALVLSESAEVRVYPPVAESLLRTAAERRGAAGSDSLRRELDRALAMAWEPEARRIQSGRARDLIVLALLGSAVLYAWRSGLVASRWFYLLSVLGCALLAFAALSRTRLLARSSESASKLRDVLVSSKKPDGATAVGDPCPVCGALDEIVATEPEKLGVPSSLAIEELRICRACGALRGRVRDASAVPIGPEHGTALVSVTPSRVEDLKSDDQESEG